LTLGVAVLLCGCRAKSPKNGDSAGAKELLLFCGAGIRPPVEALIETFGRAHNVEIVTDYAGSEVLLSKIKLSRRGDLYMPGDRYYLEQAAGQGMIILQQPVCYLIPTILVQKGNPRNVCTLHDLLRSGLKVGLGDPNACAIGKKTREILAKNRISWQDIEKNVAFLSLTVDELGMQIQARSLDAVIVWDAVAHYYADYGQEIPIPLENNVISSVDVGVLSFTVNRSLAEEFVEFAASEQARAIFKKHFYRVDPPQ
jgi:molybdate transport system substrate-binding protein